MVKTRSRYLTCRDGHQDRRTEMDRQNYDSLYAEAVQRLHFANNAVRIRMLGSIKSRRQKD